MELRKNGEFTTLETRSDANERVDRNLRYKQIIECLEEAEESGSSGLTAKQIAVMMMHKGLIPTSERNFVSPRLTELSKAGIVEPIGKRICHYTDRTVAVYALRKEE